MLKKTLLALPLLVMSMGASAELLTTAAQTQEFTGTAGNTSTEAGIDTFSFDKFDSSLGILSNVFMRTSFIIDNGFVTADNLTNQIVNGSSELGASAHFLNASEITVDASVQPILSMMELVQTATYTLAADPTMAIGGTGPDVVTVNGVLLDQTSGWKAINLAFIGGYVEVDANDDFTVDFDSASLVVVDAPGAQGLFQAVDTTIRLEVFYEYNTFPPVTEVSAPVGVAVLGLGLIGFGAMRRRKQA
jgi:hypothetical protein